MEQKNENEIVGLHNHITSILEQTWKILVAVFIAFLGNGEVITAMQSGGIFVYLIIMGGILVVCLLLGAFYVNRWWKTTITIKDQVVTVERKTMFHKKNSIAVHTISNINLEQNLFERIVRTYTIKFDTSSMSTADSTDVKIILGEKDANRVKELVMHMMTEAKLQSGELTEETEANENEVDFLSIEGERNYDVTYTDKETFMNCLYSTSVILFLTSVGFLIAAIVAVVVMIISKAGFIEGIAAILVQFVAAASLVSAMVKTWLKDFNFRATRAKDKIYVSCGAIERRQYAVPIDKINAVTLKYTFLSRLFGRAYVKVINVGGEKEDVDGMKLLLMGTPEELKEKLQVLLPEYAFNHEENQMKQPGNVLVRNLLYNIFGVLILGGGTLLGETAAFHNGGYDGEMVAMVRLITILSMIGLAMIIGISQWFHYYTNRLGYDGNYVTIVNGIYGKNIIRIPYDKIQFIKFSQGIWDRFFKIQHAEIHILASVQSRIQVSGTYSKEAFDHIIENFRKTK